MNGRCLKILSAVVFTQKSGRFLKSKNVLNNYNLWKNNPVWVALLLPGGGDHLKILSDQRDPGSDSLHGVWRGLGLGAVGQEVGL